MNVQEIFKQLTVGAIFKPEVIVLLDEIDRFFGKLK